MGDGAIPFESKVEPFVNRIRQVGNSLDGAGPKAANPESRSRVICTGVIPFGRLRHLLGLSRSEAGRLRRQAVAGGLVEGGGENQGEEGDEPARDEVYTLN